MKRVREPRDQTDHVQFACKSRTTEIAPSLDRKTIGETIGASPTKFFAVLTLALLFGAGSTLAIATPSAQANPVQLTDNDRQDRFPAIHESRVVWEGDDGHIYLFEDGATRRLTESGATGRSPQIDQGQVVWMARVDDEDFEIFLYDGASLRQLTDNTQNDMYPQIAQGEVTWEGGDAGSREIFLYDGANILQLTDNDYDDRAPRIDQGQVVWHGANAGDSEIFLYDGTTVRQLTDNEYPDLNPAIDDGQVVWQARVGPGWQIFLNDGGNTRQLTDDGYDNSSPQISRGTVVWQSRADDADYEILLHDRNGTRRLTDNNRGDWLPQISGDRVVWSGWDGTDSEIFLLTPPPPFAEVVSSNDFYPGVAYLALPHVVGGYSNNRDTLEDPGRRADLAQTIGYIYGESEDLLGNLTRIELVRLIVNSADTSLADPPPGYRAGFTDVAAEAQPLVAKAKFNGLIDGKTATTFAPDAPATRLHVSKMLFSALMR